MGRRAGLRWLNRGGDGVGAEGGDSTTNMETPSGWEGGTCGGVGPAGLSVGGSGAVGPDVFEAGHEGVYGAAMTRCLDG